MTFKQIYQQHEVTGRGTFHFNMGLTMRAILDNPAVSESHRATAQRSADQHLKSERCGQELGFTKGFTA